MLPNMPNTMPIIIMEMIIGMRSKMGCIKVAGSIFVAPFLNWSYSGLHILDPMLHR